MDSYHLLFRAARETLLEAAGTSRYLGGQVGGVMVLHTWGRNLSLHPHLHVIVPGGAISPDGQAWRSCPTGFFLPVQVLSRLFRGKLLAYLQESYDAGRLPMTRNQAHLADPCQFRRFLSPLFSMQPPTHPRFTACVPAAYGSHAVQNTWAGPLLRRLDVYKLLLLA